MLQKLFPVLLGAALLTSPLAGSSVKAEPPATSARKTNPAAVQPGAYAVDPIHTRVLFSVSHMGFTTWYGEFTNVTGTLDLDPKAPAKSAVEIHIPTNTVSTSNAKLDGELKGDQWFDAAKFPDITFKSVKVVETGKGTGKLTGDLTFHGVTKPVTLAVTFNDAGVNPLNKKYTAGFNATGSIKRSDFGVKTYLPLIGDEVDLIISAGFERQE
ncbi:YceI family protein [Methylocella tundrae]|uniref:YceI family protein n=1 Tax=Methylocella tundrae TaxID=227605 RepID=A0A4U8Z218_METTU|nr:YceI family protein [Methylocella tundrae]WPP03384.1 YceI family protein [Methylocella tundrae]VFU09432.1 YceI family protein [Methylocella tundrae]VTZ48293.1 YceI family protein [Methylocella tundrae]